MPLGSFIYRPRCHYKNSSEGLWLNASQQCCRISSLQPRAARCPKLTNVLVFDCAGCARVVRGSGRGLSKAGRQCSVARALGGESTAVIAVADICKTENSRDQHRLVDRSCLPFWVCSTLLSSYIFSVRLRRNSDYRLPIVLHSSAPPHWFTTGVLKRCCPFSTWVAVIRGICSSLCMWSGGPTSQ